MVDPITITGLVLAIVGVIQGAGRIWSRLWTRLKAVFGGLRSQSALMTVDQSRLQRELTSILQENASLRNEASRRYLDPANPFGWSDSD